MLCCWVLKVLLEYTYLLLYNSASHLSERLRWSHQSQLDSLSALQPDTLRQPRLYHQKHTDFHLCMRTNTVICFLSEQVKPYSFQESMVLKKSHSSRYIVQWLKSWASLAFGNRYLRIFYIYQVFAEEADYCTKNRLTSASTRKCLGYHYKIL
ncbi:hypothetical protein PF005_g6497 [Phytophthora fragariae]|nr:hypothetical protein PF003_g38449 [Phytophthora fragariae]KAE8942996.1 hypothetical protein PF009_g7252 [Phytophthora fragariae]KAE9020194.1 hypothetical protein PF011_g5516 [Phytophthora fragariae]KAE9120439.1 hypothetical protein PF007_g8157 [Phytophthora fragariae]KAE9148088.1 hypothetical protein PF006_g7280 [Phytophthora fragariae]